MTQTYGLYIPINGALGIWRGSAIVGEMRGDRIHVHYEGADYTPFEERITIAAGRMADRYPTVAQAWVKEEDLLKVGEVSRSERLRAWIVTEMTHPDELRDWAGEVPATGGSDHARRRAAGMAWSKLRPSVMTMIDMKVRAGGDMTDLILAEIPE